MRDTWTPVYITFCNCRWKQKLEGAREDRDILFTRSKYDVDGVYFSCGSMMGSSRSSLLSLFPIFGFSPLFTLLLPLTLFLLVSPVSEQTMKEKIEKYQDFDLYVTMNIYIKNFIYLYLNEIYRNLFHDF